MAEQQTFANHTRWFPLVHFFIMPLAALFFLYNLGMLYHGVTLARIEMIIVSIILLALNFAARLQALKAQDRVIRLEETLRYHRTLPVELAEKAGALRTNQMIALRFASDEELPGLVERTLNGEFANQKDIKKAIKNWRGDYLRV
jgi:hypothetical protein